MRPGAGITASTAARSQVAEWGLPSPALHATACRVVANPARRAQPLQLRGPSRPPTMKENNMTVARITEISSVSTVNFQDAIVQGVERANKTLKNVKGAWIKDQEVTIDNGKVTEYKVILKVTFVLFD
jgi:flavin-binding protein dodecin